jgi:hypothetical protein
MAAKLKIEKRGMKQINEYDITNELGEREYRFDGQQLLIFNINTIFESLLKHSKSLKSLGLRGALPPWNPYHGFALNPLRALSSNQTPHRFRPYSSF